MVIWLLASPNTNQRLIVAEFNTNVDLAGTSKYFEVDYIEVTGRLIYGNSSHYVTTLKFSAARSFDITCNFEMLPYRYSKGKQSVGRQQSLEIATQYIYVSTYIIIASIIMMMPCCSK